MLDLIRKRAVSIVFQLKAFGLELRVFGVELVDMQIEFEDELLLVIFKGFFYNLSQILESALAINKGRFLSS